MPRCRRTRLTKPRQFPKQLIYNPSWIESPKLPLVRDMVEDFVSKEFLEVKRSIHDVEKEWTEDDPMGTGKTFKEEFLRVRHYPPADQRRLCHAHRQCPF